MDLDEAFGFASHVDNAVQRAMVRHRVMAQLARSLWGLEAGILRSTHAAVITSLVRFGLVVTRSYAYEALIRRLETQDANVAARRTTGVSRAARLEVLRSVADILSARNLYVQQCALLVGRALRAHACLLQDVARGYLATVCSLRDWGGQRSEVEAPKHKLGQRRSLGDQESSIRG